MPSHAQDTDVLAVHFRAEHLPLSAEETSSIVAFGDDSEQPANYMLLQRIASPSQQDIKLGHDQVHIEINGPERSGYGAIKECRLRDQGLRITLNNDAAARLRVASDIHIELTSDADRLNELTAFLKKLFANGDEFQRQ